MAEETKPVEEVVEEAAVETPVAETPVVEPAVEAPAVAEKAAEAPVVEPAVETPAVAEKAAEAPAKEKAPADKKEAEKKPVRERDRDIFAAIEGDKEEDAKPKRKMKGAKNIPYGIAFIKTTFNNTIVSLTDMKGEVVSWSSAGRCGFKGSRKSTAFAATTVAQEAARGAISHGMNEVEVRVQGPGAGRESAVRAIQAAGLRVSAIKDTTPVPHNGCRPKKQRRV
ncbi:MAG: 30S ribosomal protein S11 [Kiritimatiellales bacterium]|nr:30S ribosomal protein S11 [Kiritimatiellota bacterium]MBL7011589.1 30S ribosomal protein S11 [Kiritimatiellales bacterium]